MTFLDVYIGELGEPLPKTAADLDGRVPRRRSPFLPAIGSRNEVFHTLIRHLETGKLEGAKVDWGTWVALVDKPGILRFLDDVYDPASLPERDRYELALVRSFVADLQDDREYALVAAEF